MAQKQRRGKNNARKFTKKMEFGDSDFLSVLCYGNFVLLFEHGMAGSYLRLRSGFPVRTPNVFCTFQENILDIARTWVERCPKSEYDRRGGKSCTGKRSRYTQITAKGAHMEEARNMLLPGGLCAARVMPWASP